MSSDKQMSRWNRKPHKKKEGEKSLKPLFFFLCLMRKPFEMERILPVESEDVSITNCVSSQQWEAFKKFETFHIYTDEFHFSVGNLLYMTVTNSPQNYQQKCIFCVAWLLLRTVRRQKRCSYILLCNKILLFADYYQFHVYILAESIIRCIRESAAMIQSMLWQLQLTTFTYISRTKRIRNYCKIMCKYQSARFKPYEIYQA